MMHILFMVFFRSIFDFFFGHFDDGYIANHNNKQEMCFSLIGKVLEFMDF